MCLRKLSERVVLLKNKTKNQLFPTGPESNGFLLAVAEQLDNEMNTSGGAQGKGSEECLNQGGGGASNKPPPTPHPHGSTETRTPCLNEPKLPSAATPVRNQSERVWIYSRRARTPPSAVWVRRSDPDSQRAGEGASPAAAEPSFLHSRLFNVTAQLEFGCCKQLQLQMTPPRQHNGLLLCKLCTK